MSINSYKPLALLVLAFFTYPSPVFAADWGLSYGIHDLFVADAHPVEDAPNGTDSHTLGVDVGIYGKHITESNILLTGSHTTFLSFDVDKLDSDYIPVWFITDFTAKADLYNFTSDLSLFWLVDIDFKMNTVSGIENLFKFFPGMNLSYETESFSVAVKAALGRYYLEIDNDVSRTRGYPRHSLGHATYSYSLMAETTVVIDQSYSLSASAQSWHDSNELLENKYKLQLNYDANSYREGSVFIFSLERTEFNLDHYAIIDTSSPDYLPILPWNSDTLFRAYMVFPI